MKLLQEFRAFAMRGNVADMAVGIIIGAAFGKIVSSFVEDVIMPPLGLLIGGVSFTDLAITLQPAAGEVAAVTLKYGRFIQTLFDFIIIAFAIFMVIKVMNSLNRKAEKPAEDPASSPEVRLLSEIRDLLKTPQR
ncbi:MAG: large-conductance mechanosensitive channel protein MscL [Pseudomonadota bacterium]